MFNTQNRLLTNSYSKLEQPIKIIAIADLENSSHQSNAGYHRHEYFEIIFLSRGKGVCCLEMDVIDLDSKSICYIRPGQVHKVLFESSAAGYILQFTQDFFYSSVEKSLVAPAISDLRFPGVSKLNVDLLSGLEISEILAKIAKECQSPGLFGIEVMRGLLKILLIYFTRILSSNQVFRLSRTSKIAKQFFSILEEDFGVRKTATDYASALAVTPNYLNGTLKKVSGNTTSYHIHHRILAEAKRLTVHSGHSMKEIAYQLGFDDMAHFSKFFKKNSGLCFKDFRQQALSGVPSAN